MAYNSGFFNKVSIEQSSQTAKLHLGAGTATTGTAPIKLTSGTNLTAPEAGTIEFNGTNLFYTTDALSRVTVGTGNGDVTGPVSSTDNATVRFDSTTGKILQNSGVIIDDSNNITGVGAFTASGNSFFGTTSSTDIAKLTAFSTSPVPLRCVLSTALTIDPSTALVIQHDSTGNIADGFGVSLSFEIRDDAEGTFNIGDISAIRAGADTTSDLRFRSKSLGSFVENLRLFSTGVVSCLAGDFNVVRSASGSTITATVSNTSNTASSSALCSMVVAGTSGGDAFNTYTVTGAGSWSCGIDNSDSDNYKISNSTALGTTDIITVASTGLTVSNSLSGSSVSSTVSNTSNTASSNALSTITVAGTSAGDAFTTYTVTSGGSWSCGIDNSASDNFKLANSTALGTTDILTVASTGLTVTGGLQADYAVYCEQQTANTNGGTFTSGSYQTRTLNTTLVQQGSSISRSSNVITLQAGTYYVYATAPAYAVSQHKAILRNTSDSTTAIVGTSAYNDAAVNIQGMSVVCGTITVASAKNFELQHRGTATKTTNGFGVAGNLGEVEVYSQIYISRTA